MSATLAAGLDVASVATELGITGMLAHGFPYHVTELAPARCAHALCRRPLPLDDGVCDLASVFMPTSRSPRGWSDRRSA